MKINKNLVVWIILISFVAAALIWKFQILPTGGNVQISPSSAKGEVLELIARLKVIEIDAAFFDNPDFLKLTAFPKPELTGLSRGRPNPFLPVATPSVPSTKR